ncbi:MAG TPA: hypothetical protein VKX49_28835 [Bryobacteraceae bacterium]|nr:hypothetical protein [Bryobacteraceae bacterium]
MQLTQTSTASGFDISQEHPEYAAHRRVWHQYRDLYVGGEQFKTRADHYLVRRQKEPLDVYAERLSRSFYENYIGSIIDWYTATLFRREPVLTFEGNNDRAKRFYGKFIDDCDLKGASFAEFFRRQFIEALICGKSYILVDFPRQIRPAGTRAEEDERGASRAYLVGYSADELINWSYDEHGHFQWVVLRTESLRKDKIEDAAWDKQTRWVYYDKENYRIYEQSGEGQERGRIQMTAEGRHGLAKQLRVPILELRISEGLWLLNKAGSLQLEHFNKSNALGWALTMGLFAMPVVYSERDWNQVMGESYYIQLGPQDRFGWTEPQGNVYQIAADNLTRLQEEIYRVCYVTHAGGAISGAVAQSGASKQRDFAITQEVLRAYGDAVKDGMKRVLRAIDQAREDGLSIDVSGVDEFDIGDFGTELSDAERLLALGIESPTLKRQVFKKVAFQFLCDVRQEVKDRIGREIDQAG